MKINRIQDDGSFEENTLKDSLKINKQDDGSFQVEWDRNDPNWKFMNDLTTEEIESIVQEAIKHDQNERQRQQPQLFVD